MTDEAAVVEIVDTVETLTPKKNQADVEGTEADDEEEDFNPLGKIEGWSAFECSTGPFGQRG